MKIRRQEKNLFKPNFEKSWYRNILCCLSISAITFCTDIQFTRFLRPWKEDSKIYNISIHHKFGKKNMLEVKRGLESKVKINWGMDFNYLISKKRVKIIRQEKKFVKAKI